MKSEPLATFLARACREIIAWQFDLITTEECCQLFVQQGQVQGVQVLKVVVALLVAWGLITIEEIVIE